MANRVSRLPSLGAALLVVGGFAIALFARPVGPVGQPRMVVYKDPACGCCKKWVQHVEAAGFRVAVRDTADLDAVTARYAVPKNLTACHTAVAAGYVFEGHVPADVIERLLKERPAVVGLAVPGMPAGSPGMDSPTPAHYDIIAFDRAGKTSVYASR